MRRNFPRFFYALGRRRSFHTAWARTGHWQPFILYLPALFASGFATSRACLMKSSATGLSVLFFSLMMPSGPGLAGSSIGKTLNEISFGLKCNSERGRTLRRFPPASKALWSGIENDTTLIRGGGKPAALNESINREWAKLSGVGTAQDSLTSSASVSLRRDAHRLCFPATTRASSK